MATEADSQADPGEQYRFRRRRRTPEIWTAERIAALRARLGLTQSAFADEIGVRQQTVSEWETGRYLPRGTSTRLLGMLAEDADDDFSGAAGGPSSASDPGEENAGRDGGAEARK